MNSQNNLGSSCGYLPLWSMILESWVGNSNLKCRHERPFSAILYYYLMSGLQNLLFLIASINDSLLRTGARHSTRMSLNWLNIKLFDRKAKRLTDTMDLTTITMSPESDMKRGSVLSYQINTLLMNRRSLKRPSIFSIVYNWCEWWNLWYGISWYHEEVIYKIW